MLNLILFIKESPLFYLSLLRVQFVLFGFWKNLTLAMQKSPWIHRVDSLKKVTLAN